jgi:hypothetical protein
MVKKCQRYERPTSYHKLNYPAQISTALYSIFVLFWGTPTLGTFTPEFFLHYMV